MDKGINISPKKITFGEFSDFWLKDYGRSNLSLKTLDGYRSIINNHLKPEIGNIPLAKLQPHNLREFYSILLREGRRDNKKSVDRGLSPTTVLNIHRVIHEALNHALQWELVPRNVSDVVKPPKHEEKETPFIPYEKIKELLNTLNGTCLYLPTYIAISTGMRLGEILGLHWEDVDLERRVITVRQTAGIKRKDTLEELPAKGRNEVYFKNSQNQTK